MLSVEPADVPGPEAGIVLLVFAEPSVKVCATKDVG